MVRKKKEKTHASLPQKTTVKKNKRSHLFIFFTLGIMLLAIILRFYSYPTRWGLGYDQALFAITGRYAIDAVKLPLLGPFSSAGPFQTGGEWYWLVMMGTFLFRPMVEAPWIGMGILSLCTIVVMMIIGKKLGGTLLALIAGLFTAISTAEITQSVNLSNQTPIALPASTTILFSLLYLEKKKPLYLFLAGLSIGIASSIHLQGIGLLPILLFAIVFAGLPKLTSLLAAGTGLLLPWLPVFVSDSHHHWQNTKNMIYYYRFDQYNVSLAVLGRNWKTFLGQFVPHIVGFTIGGNDIIGFLLIALLLGTFLCLLWKRKLTKSWTFLSVSFASLLVIVRYTHAPLFESFVVFLHPSILILVSGVVVAWFRKMKILGIVLLMILLFSTLQKNWEEITHATNTSRLDMMKFSSYLEQTFPDKKFVIYDFHNKTRQKSLPLVLLLETKNKLDEQGMPIGISFPEPPQDIPHRLIHEDVSGIRFWDLSASSSSVLEKDNWASQMPSTVYKETQSWYQ